MTQPFEMSSTLAGHLSVESTAPSHARPHGEIVIVGNAYGRMAYQPALAMELAGRGYRAHVFSFSGQDGMSGKYCTEQGVKDLGNVCDTVREKSGGQPLHIIAHCAGSIIAQEYLHQRGHSGISSLTVYGMLRTPGRRRDYAEPRLEARGVQHALGDEDWNYDWLARASEIPLPVLFCHAHDSINLDRATPEEVEAAAAAVRGAHVQWFEEGYDSSLHTVPLFADVYERHIQAAQG